MVNMQNMEMKEAKIAIILEALGEYPHIGNACKKARITRETLRRWRKLDPDLDQAVRRALLEGDEVLEDVAMEEAIKKRNATLIIFLMKTRIRDRYGDRMEHTGSGGSPIQIVLAQREDGPQ